MSSSSPSTRACLGAEFIGTLWLVVGGCGTAILATSKDLSVGTLGVSLAFGLSVLTMAFALGPISGGHFNPAVSLGLALAKRFSWNKLGPYALAQVLGGTVGAAFLFIIASGKDGFDASAGFAANGFDSHSPGGYSLVAALVVEILLTALFLYVILGATDARSAVGFAPIAIGLALTLIHLISIPVTNT
ncbi:MAG: aquaporin Z, partial [Angustibacter sp.]